MIISKPIKGTLVFFCGKMGAGKSTLSRRIAAEKNAVLLSEDEWLQALYNPDEQIKTLQDYIHYSARLKAPMKTLVQSILTTGTNVVMDFPANTPQQRRWFQRLYTQVEANHELVYLDVPDAVCLERIAQRCIQQPERAATNTPEMFAQVTQYFVPPAEEEGFTILRHHDALS